MKTLILCRHAKSDWPDGVGDSKRPLKERGIKDAKNQGKLLSQRGVTIDRMISSHANRAISTARIIAKEVGYTDPIEQDSSLYHQGAGNLISVVQDLPVEVDVAMLFGHNPTMEQTVQFFLRAERSIGMPTCAMACFEFFNSSWSSISPTSCQLRWLIIPRLKRKVLLG